jgi:hypothetical protein
MTAPVKNDAPPNPYAYKAPEDDTSWRIVRNVRVGLTLLLAFLGARALRDEYGQVPLISDIGVAIHEFGHALFQPFGFQIFGETMVILGGSLFEFVFPLFFVAYFALDRKHRDLHAAMCCLWWGAINLIHVSIYAGDARAGVLPLLNGLTGQDEDSGHDWQALFTQWGVLHRDTLYARQMKTVAFLMFAVSILVGLYYAWQRPVPKAEE